MAVPLTGWMVWHMGVGQAVRHVRAGVHTHVHARLMRSNIAPDRMVASSALSNSLHTLNAAMGTAISITMWERLSTNHYSRLVENISPGSPLSIDYLYTLQTGGLLLEQAYAVVDRTISEFQRRV